MKPFPVDPRPAQPLERHHRRTRKRAPWLQAVLFTALAPVVFEPDPEPTREANAQIADAVKALAP